MLETNYKRRFGHSAIQKGFITKNQLLQAMGVQIENEKNDADSEPIGIILRKLGFMTLKQTEDVLKDIPNVEIFKCPSCGILFHECPNCGADLLKLECNDRVKTPIDSCNSIQESQATLPPFRFCN